MKKKPAFCSRILWIGINIYITVKIFEIDVKILYFLYIMNKNWTRRMKKNWTL